MQKPLFWFGNKDKMVQYILKCIIDNKMIEPNKMVKKDAYGDMCKRHIIWLCKEICESYNIDVNTVLKLN